jgi:hypothetical protein
MLKGLFGLPGCTIMEFNKGDKVRFLNEEGEGTVLGKTTGNKILVLTAEGMELAFSPGELVHADTEKLHKTITAVPGKIREQKRSVVPVVQEKQEEDGSSAGADGIYLLFTPKDEEKLLECDIEIGLVNNTDYDILYAYSYKYEKEFVAMCNGSADEGSVTLLDTIVRSRMEEYATVKVDLIFYKNMPYEPLEPLSEIIKLKTVKFYKPNTYHRNPYNERLSHIISVCLFEEVQEMKKGISSDIQKKVAEFMSRKKGDGRNISRSHEFYAKQLEKEVDLHLEELLENTSGMSSGEKLNYQLNYFKRELENAISGNIRKIVFIHGIGSGKLRSEIHRILDTYQHLRYHDASFRKYGFGATEVIVR